MKAPFTTMLAAALALAGASGVEAGTVTVATGEYVPYTTEADAGGGIVNNLVTRAFAEAGLTVSYTYLPWKRALEETRDGRYQASSYWGYDAERDADFVQVGPVMADDIVFYRLADTPEPRWTDLAELAGYRIGGVTGYTYSAGFWDLAGNGTLNVEVATSDEANFRKLLAGRIDIFPATRATGEQILATGFTPEERARIVACEQPLDVTVGYLLIPRAIPDAEALAARFRQGLAVLDARGELDALMRVAGN